jgi:Rps23 Pro-64 3,4-dihydroxylase Tpa1-like proline 4-hydroxylase
MPDIARHSKDNSMDAAPYEKELKLSAQNRRPHACPPGMRPPYLVHVIGRGLHSFPFQLNLSYSVHPITNLTHECVLELLKLSSHVNECKPLFLGYAVALAVGMLGHSVLQPKSAQVHVSYGAGTYNGTIESSFTEWFSAARLTRLAAAKRAEFRAAEPFPHAVFDDFLDPELLRAVVTEFQESDYASACRRGGTGALDSVACFYKPRAVEDKQYRKAAMLDEAAMGPYTRVLFALLKSSLFVRFLEELSSIENIVADPHFRGGLHQTETGGFLKLHADFNRYPEYGLDRRVNVFLFLNEEWDDAWGGHLQLWPRNMSQCGANIRPTFNRLVAFRSSDFSYHGRAVQFDPRLTPDRTSLVSALEARSWKNRFQTLLAM